MTSSAPEHMPMADIASDSPAEAAAATEGNGRKRPKPGERRVQIRWRPCWSNLAPNA